MNLKFLTVFNKLKVNFEDPLEIRMGSPYMICKNVILKGTKHKYILEKYSFQNKCLIIHDRRTIILVKWATAKNEPGFELVMINDQLNEITKLDRIAGLCNDIIISENGFRVEYTFDSKIFYQEVSL